LQGFAGKGASNKSGVIENGDFRLFYPPYLKPSHLRPQLKASVEEEVIVHKSEIEKNAFKVFKLKQLVSCLNLIFSSQEKDR